MSPIIRAEILRAQIVDELDGSYVQYLMHIYPGAVREFIRRGELFWVEVDEHNVKLFNAAYESVESSMLPKQYSAAFKAHKEYRERYVLEKS